MSSNSAEPSGDCKDEGTAGASDVSNEAVNERGSCKVNPEGSALGAGDGADFVGDVSEATWTWPDGKAVIEATVVTGLETMAREEIREKLGVQAGITRGRVCFAVDDKQVEDVSENFKWYYIVYLFVGLFISVSVCICYLLYVLDHERVPFTSWKKTGFKKVVKKICVTTRIRTRSIRSSIRVEVT